ncbi:hypothetical protein J1N51_07890 [Psychrosphaera ytuae]|uniref:Uncharacterized protein n=1 Tax=Psychrosphaera ytuae TaxID=2820710 RepID=A0A975D9A7_9GAMM|nr:hypothetical protein [Psychrosphaera ytuae]QTH62703.1 hypothetical protein J1N51_07890 [Psychrosphaera ytuae]
MALRLSQKGWNNVLIFSCMFMILLFNYTNNMLMSDEQDQVVAPLLPPDAIIQAIDFSGVELQRVGPSWRVLSQVPNPQIERPEAFVETWQNQPLTSLAHSPMLMENATAWPVVVWVAGQEEGWVFEFVIDTTEQTVYINARRDERWYQLDYAQLPQFVPSVVLNTQTEQNN